MRRVADWGSLTSVGDGGMRTRVGAASSATEIALFGALAFVGFAQWSRLVAQSPLIKLLFALALICAGARLLLALPRGPDRGPASTLAAAGISLFTLVLALMLAGLSARLLLPGNWGELGATIGDGIRGIEDSPVPYSGSSTAIPLVLTLAGPAMAALAAAIGFWPAADRSRRRLGALILLVASFAIPITLYPPGGQLFWGLVVLALSVSWLWIAQLSGARRNLALAVALAAGVLAMPVAARAGDEPILDYQNWDWFGGSASVSFQWNHEYGPLDWPRDGATMLSVETSRPLYWKASVLDRFDGYRWSRADVNDPTALAERNARQEMPVGVLTDLHPGWVQEATFRVEGLRTDLVIGAGVPLAVTEVDVAASADGTLTHKGGTLDGGSEYSVVTYDPNPTVNQLQSAPARYPEKRFAATTLLALPSSTGPPETMAMPLWGTTNPAIENRVLASPYAEAYSLARAWTETATTPYEALTAIQTRLGEYAYTPEVPISQYPLNSFLFDDQAGYCQQFAGSLALMARMVGIPARVVSGFAPGTPDSSDGSYEVHDYDAHSWVEVFFRGIGWVTFDPTPAAAPAESQRLGGEEPERRGAALLSEGGENGLQGGRSSADAAGATDQATEGGTGAALTIALLGLLAAALAIAVFSYRRRRVPMGDPAEAQIAELRAALDRTGWNLRGGTTLLQLEERIADAGRRPIVDYVRALRRNRFAPDGSPLPTAAQRRALRNALIAGGPARRLRAWMLVPPGGPRPRR